MKNEHYNIVILDGFIDDHGGYWDGEHPDFKISDWKKEVLDGDTRMSYWEWAYRQSKNDY